MQDIHESNNSEKQKHIILNPLIQCNCTSFAAIPPLSFIVFRVKRETKGYSSKHFLDILIQEDIYTIKKILKLKEKKILRAME